MIRRIYHTYRSSFGGLSRETWLLSAVMLVNRAGTMAVPFMSLYVTRHLGRSIADAGLIITLFGIGSVLGALLGGWLTDRIGFRWVQIVAALLSGLLFMLYGTIRDFPTLCVLTVCLSLVADALRPANHAAIAAYSSRDNLTRAYTLNRLAINLGWAVGGALGGLLAAINYQLLFWVEGATNLLAALLIWTMLPALAWSSRRRQAHEAGSRTEGLQPWQDRVFLQFMALATLFTTSFFLVFRLVPVYWREEWQLGERIIGALLAYNGLIIALLEMVLVKRWEARGALMRYIVAGSVACAAAYAFLMLPGIAPLVLALAFMTAVTLGEMLAFPFINSLVMRRATEYNRGMYATTITLSWSFAQIIGPSGGGWIAERWGFGWLWPVLIGLCLLTGWGFHALRHRI